MYDYLCPFRYWGDKFKDEVFEHDHKKPLVLALVLIKRVYNANLEMIS